MKSNVFIGLLFFIAIGTSAQTQFLVKPYLQDAEPHSVKIKWETSEGEESVVEWGLTPQFGHLSKGSSSEVYYGGGIIHEVKLHSLKRFTVYYYRVKTGTLFSDTYQFKTPPFAEDRESFSLIAMSDMQKDHNNPDKFGEVVNEGILKYMTEKFDGKLPDNLAMVLVPGDLVENGLEYGQWQKDFFSPGEKLFSEVPVYPVLGNHEKNSTYYFKYFSLPRNGSPSFKEHWWYKDYGNTRIIGLNSNEGFRDAKQQYNWLKQTLRNTARDKSIDFVFAELHHPFKSELWIPGEEEFTGKVIKLLEDFSEKSGKPSIHFFGHTHGYSRGQSKDHKHLWINVASAGGALDNWGEFEGKDYDEFSVTQDEYGFVMVQIDANEEDPKFTIKRISRGNEENPKDNVLSDSLTIYKHERKPLKPSGLYPIKETVEITGTVLKANDFNSTFPSSMHAASNWQIDTNKEFSSPIVDSWKQSENWYFNENRQKDDDLTDEPTGGLLPNTTYYWRVRYRDQNLNWSDWSEVLSFKTAE